jgi:3-oxoacyl-[acyl-carrier-protein] synthase-3
LIKAGIISTGFYVPERKILNTDLNQWVRNYDPEISGKSLDEWIISRYGIESRRWADKETLTSDMAYLAAEDALQSGGLDVEDIDFLILNTATGDYPQPTTATAVQRRLGMKPESFAIELNMPCAGPVYGIVLAKNFILSGKYKKGLVVGADKMSSLIDLADFRMAGLFGEGAGACIVGRVPDSGILGEFIRSKGEEGNPNDYALIVPGGGVVNPGRAENGSPALRFLQMNGPKVEAFIESCLGETIENLLSEVGWTLADLDYFVPHQAAKKSLINLAHSAGIPVSKLVLTLQYFGNTSSASILITLDSLFRTKLPGGTRILVAGMGGGLNWGGFLYEVPSFA